MDAEQQNNTLTLSKLWFYLQNPLKVMEVLTRICDACESFKGGIILDKLYKICQEQIDP